MRIAWLALLIVFPVTALYPQRAATVVDTADGVVARKLAAIPLEVFVADSNLHIINVYKLQATILRESQGQSPEAIVDRLTREVYTPYSAFWEGYMGDEAAFRRWATTTFLASDHPVRTRLAAWLDLRLDLQFTAVSRWIVQTTGRRPKGRWYLVFGPGWTDMGGFTDGTMVADFSQAQFLPDSSDLTLKLAHELTHEVTGVDSVDADNGTVLSRMVSEGLASYASYVYGTARSLTPAQALGYTEGEWTWALAHEADLIAAGKSILYSRERADLDRVAARRERLVNGGPPAAGYFLGFRMVQAYVKGHGPESWSDLLRLPVREVLRRSGYPLH